MLHTLNVLVLLCCLFRFVSVAYCCLWSTRDVQVCGRARQAAFACPPTRKYVGHRGISFPILPYPNLSYPIILWCGVTSPKPVLGIDVDMAGRVKAFALGWHTSLLTGFEVVFGCNDEVVLVGRHYCCV